ncbi:uncharacterized protein L969DRAFT_19640 [Mixia osmundae IAM 14324]|uniref:Nucleolus and neural progenitor protein-like N-terminal domain-containing protein n=1 Tax=Mixia osmundae (strain CBS 9802 / IAM 14324 / JCM 22182 / KY 12970) TaxID=764103 RepID=G7DSX5_MIXOS|nr:uncharacterized protein L969DRAFT_19640 [Mixia osmundae IAM 14324]KEI37099.1 hypothetical protein L969DRAFT_19640 [Mixia osmundae IAM 14324]GAA93685.1 hypothetical protein E5Q_00330 [Mixia osmundae IAM 14324]
MPRRKPARYVPVPASLKKAITRSSGLITEDLILLRRIIYKSTNQYRHFAWWRRIEQVCKLASRMERELRFCIVDFDAPPPISEISVKLGGACLDACRQHAKTALRLADKLHQVNELAYADLQQVINTRYFVQLAAVLLAILARFEIVTKTLALDLARLGDTLASPAAAILPSLQPRPVPKPQTQAATSQPAVVRRRAVKPKPTPEASKNEIDDIFGS